MLKIIFENERFSGKAFTFDASSAVATGRGEEQEAVPTPLPLIEACDLLFWMTLYELLIARSKVTTNF